MTYYLFSDGWVRRVFASPGFDRIAVVTQALKGVGPTIPLRPHIQSRAPETVSARPEVLVAVVVHVITAKPKKIGFRASGTLAAIGGHELLFDLFMPNCTGLRFLDRTTSVIPLFLLNLHFISFLSAIVQVLDSDAWLVRVPPCFLCGVDALKVLRSVLFTLI